MTRNQQIEEELNNFEWLKYEEYIIRKTFDDNKDILINPYIQLNFDYTYPAYLSGCACPMAVSNMGNITIFLAILDSAINYTCDKIEADVMKLATSMCIYTILHEMIHINQHISPFGYINIPDYLLKTENDATIMAIEYMRQRYPDISEEYLEYNVMFGYRRAFMQTLPKEEYSLEVFYIDSLFTMIMYHHYNLYTDEQIAAYPVNPREFVPLLNNIVVEYNINGNHRICILKKDKEYLPVSKDYAELLTVLFSNCLGTMNNTNTSLNLNIDKCALSFKISSNIYGIGFYDTNKYGMFNAYELDFDEYNKTFSDIDIVKE